MKAFKFATLAVMTAIATVTTTANAGVGEMLHNDTNPVAISAEVGSLGYGANVAWGVNEYTELQVGWVGGDIVDLAGKSDFDVNDVDFEAETDFSTPYVGVQMRPMKNWFTVGAGVMHMGNNSINAVATPKIGTTVTFEGSDYEVTSNDAKVDAKIEFKNTMAPYLSLGFRPNINNRFGLFGEIGAAYVGGTNVDVQADGSFTLNGAPVDKQASADKFTKLENNARQEIEDKIDGKDKWYPIIKVGATIRF